MLGSGHYLWRVVSTFFLVKILRIQPLKSQKNFAQTNLKYELKILYTHPWPKTLQKDTIQLSHMSFTTSVT
jgi:hypothetical protein